MADDDALFQKGMPIRREVLGPEYVDASMARADEFMMSFQRATTAWAWGWAWGDPTLDRKTRSLMNLAMLTALNRAPEIKLHVKGALNTCGQAYCTAAGNVTVARLINSASATSTS
jgi:4-carboxymuconolactone decarboxylase